MQKPVIHLMEAVGTALIIEHATGVVYETQTGGTACLHPSLEGVFVPLANDFRFNSGGGWETAQFRSPETDLFDYFVGPKHAGTGATNGIDSEDADVIETILDKYMRERWIEVDRQRMRESCEAWVFVTIPSDFEERANVPLIQGFGPYPRKGVLTWLNSD